MSERPKFAARTEVPVDQSKSEIEAVTKRYGADGFIIGWEVDKAMVQFRCANRYVRFVLSTPAASGEQARKQKWRALALVIKAKLEAVDAGIATFESEFLANVVLPDGETVYDRAKPALAVAYETGRAPTMLPDYSKRNEKPQSH